MTDYPRHTSPQNQQPRLVSILSGKGGVGKSVVSYNLAVALSESFSVLLVDADLNCGNQHILSNVAPDGGLRAFLRGDRSLSDAVIELRPRLHLLASVSEGFVTPDSGARPIAHLVEKLRTESTGYDLVLFDHSSGISDTATVIAHASDISLLLVVPELTSISDCYGLFKHLKAADSAIDCRLVINRAVSDDEAEFIYSRLFALTERFLEQTPRYSGMIPEDAGVRACVAAQRSIFDSKNQSPAAQALVRLAKKLAQELCLTPLNITYQPNPVTNKTAAMADIRE